MPSPLVQALAFQNSVNPPQTAVGPTDVVGAYRLASDAAEKNYAAKLANQQAMWGGLAGIGGAGLSAFGPTLAKKWFPGAGTSNSLAPTADPLGGSFGANLGAGGAGAGAADPLAGSVGASLGGTAGADALGGSIAADLGAAGATDLAAAGATDAAAATLPEWLAALLALV